MLLSVPTSTPRLRCLRSSFSLWPCKSLHAPFLSPTSSSGAIFSQNPLFLFRKTCNLYCLNIRYEVCVWICISTNICISTCINIYIRIYVSIHNDTHKHIHRISTRTRQENTSVYIRTLGKGGVVHPSPSHPIRSQRGVSSTNPVQDEGRRRQTLVISLLPQMKHMHTKSGCAS